MSHGSRRIDTRYKGQATKGAGHKNAQEEHKEGEREGGVESEQEDGEQAEE
jgi:hypothetical protein